MDIRPEWTAEIPEGWEERLRQFSPIVDATSHLRFRRRFDVNQWMLYECTPAALLSPYRNEQLRTHWSDLPVSQQMGRRQLVSEYQHYMYRTHGVEAMPFWVLQGPAGGTPAAYTERERKLLKANNAPDDPPPAGFLDACSFDERAVEAIVSRDLLIKIGGNLDALARSREGAALAKEDEETEREYRKAFLGWWFDACLPMSEFMQMYLRSSESDHNMRRATSAEANAVAQWRDHFVETGELIGATQGSSLAINVPITLTK